MFFIMNIYPFRCKRHLKAFEKHADSVETAHIELSLPEICIVCQLDIKFFQISYWTKNEVVQFLSRKESTLWNSAVKLPNNKWIKLNSKDHSSSTSLSQMMYGSLFYFELTRIHRFSFPPFWHVFQILFYMFTHSDASAADFLWKHCYKQKNILR